MLHYRIRIEATKYKDYDERERYAMDIDASTRDGEEMSNEELTFVTDLMLDKLVKLVKKTCAAEAESDE